jgi:hypothetical protein
MNNKQRTKKEHAAEGTGCSEHTREVGRDKKLTLHELSVNSLEKQMS